MRARTGASKHTAQPTTNQHGRERMGFHSSEISRDFWGISESVGVAYRMGDLDPDAKLDIIVARHLRMRTTHLGFDLPRASPR